MTINVRRTLALLAVVGFIAPATASAHGQDDKPKTAPQHEKGDDRGKDRGKDDKGKKPCNPKPDKPTTPPVTPPTPPTTPTPPVVTPPQPPAATPSAPVATPVTPVSRPVATKPKSKPKKANRRKGKLVCNTRSCVNRVTARERRERAEVQARKRATRSPAFTG